MRYLQPFRATWYAHFPVSYHIIDFSGDSYLAVTGLPKPQERHALYMARFAWDCLWKFAELTRELETTLGPDTTELGIRVGMHSGESGRDCDL